MDVLKKAYHLAAAYRTSVTARPVPPRKTYRQMREAFARPLPETGSPETAVLEELATLGEPGLMHTVHPRFFGWVMGASAPVGVAADWLAAAWGQNVAMHKTSPTAAAIEETASNWLLDLLDLPRSAAVGFVTGGTMGSFTALAAARGELLRRQGWDCEEAGLFGAPPIHVFVGDDVHTSVLSVLGHLGMGAGRVVSVATDTQGRMEPRALSQHCKAMHGAKLIIAQAGQINTGAFDPFEDLGDIAARHEAWLHVDGAFGLWGRAHPDLKPLTAGIERADSWVVDGHKWLQVPFDAGYAIVRDGAALQRAMAITASYLPEPGQGDRVPSYLVPELSRRARGLPTWAMLRALGRSGFVDMIDRHCALARQIAQDLGSTPGIRVMNDVVLNQVVLRFGHECDDPERRRCLAAAVIDELVEDGEMFVGGTAWRGEWLMRISVIGSATTARDGHVVVRAVRSAWDRVCTRYGAAPVD